MINICHVAAINRHFTTGLKNKCLNVFFHEEFEECTVGSKIIRALALILPIFL